MVVAVDQRLVLNENLRECYEEDLKVLELCHLLAFLLAPT
jgi:hypothetical protein